MHQRLRARRRDPGAATTQRFQHQELADQVGRQRRQAAIGAAARAHRGIGLGVEALIDGQFPSRLGWRGQRVLWQAATRSGQHQQVLVGRADATR
ncbi:MAG: hypothetical protein Q8M96_12325, partial [Rubrivivax sp.]|nr:hypothetical protein [Rubrivivax sp.]